MRFFLPIALLFVAVFAAPVARAESVRELSINEVLTEHVIGEPNAPVTIIEYASLTCGHCAHFHKNILPSLTEKYISTGKVKLIYRDFPLDGTALKAAQLAHCMPEDRYFPFIKTLFDNQETWAHAQDVDATLTQYAKLAGLPGERITSCLANKTIQEAIVKRRMEAEKQFKVEATPTFVFDYGAETLSGVGSFADIDVVVQKFLNKAEKKK